MTMYPDYQDIVSEAAMFLLKEKQDKYFRYYPLKTVMKLLAKGKELYSLNQDIQLRRIVSIEERGLQTFHELTTFKGSRVIMGTEMQLFIDTFWLPLPEVEFHEKLYEYDYQMDHFYLTYITHIRDLGKRQWSFKFTSEDDSGIILNNLIIRTPSPQILAEEKTAWQKANDDLLINH